MHTDSQADLLNQQLSARAFTTARDIFFRQGEYSLGSGTGKKLIAHELPHVVQQNIRQIQRFKVDESGTAYEKDIPSLDYYECLKYRDYQLRNMEAERKKVEKKDWPYKIAFASGEWQALLDRIEWFKEEAVDHIKCTEGSLEYTIRPGQRLDYGYVDSCMTVSCYLDNGLVVGMHEALGARVPGGIGRLAQQAQRLGHIDSVEAMGEPTDWAYPHNVELELVGSLEVAMEGKEFPPPNYTKLREPNDEGKIVDNRADFERWLSAKLGARAEFIPKDRTKVVVENPMAPLKGTKAELFGTPGTKLGGTKSELMETP